MPTQKEIKEIERVYQKPFSEIEEFEIPSYIRKRDEEAKARARALDQLEEEGIQMEKERKEKEKYDQI